MGKNLKIDENKQYKFKIELKVIAYDIPADMTDEERQALPTEFVFDDIVCIKDELIPIACERIVQQVGYSILTVGSIITAADPIETENTDENPIDAAVNAALASFDL